MNVAPYVGAWIETMNQENATIAYKSHPTWVRGLKRNLKQYQVLQNQSHPTWVRGLKLKGLGFGLMLKGRTLRGCVD